MWKGTTILSLSLSLSQNFCVKTNDSYYRYDDVDNKVNSSHVCIKSVIILARNCRVFASILE